MSNAKPTAANAIAKNKTSSGKKSSRGRSKTPRINSRQKGVSGELEFRDVLRTYGFEAKRGQQHAGGSDSADVRHSIPGIHFEVKRVQAGNPYVWLEQARRDVSGPVSSAMEGPERTSGEGVSRPRVPVIAHRRNHKQWIAVLDMDAFIDILLKGFGV